uniref:Uncharacterized protein n=1 Tax=Glossina pallidipes TaxID=7398 RepID=A0A1B0A4L9_GLOPL
MIVSAYRKSFAVLRQGLSETNYPGCALHIDLARQEKMSMRHYVYDSQIINITNDFFNFNKNIRKLTLYTPPLELAGDTQGDLGPFNASRDATTVISSLIGEVKLVLRDVSSVCSSVIHSKISFDAACVIITACILMRLACYSFTGFKLIK